MLKKILKWFWGIIEALIIVYVIFITTCILFRNKYGYTDFFDKYTFVTISENSQRFLPNHDAGDLLIIKNQQFSIDKGDVIYYYATVNDEYIVRSGAVESITGDDISALYVLADEDKTSVSNTRVIGKKVSVHPGKGSILDILESRVGFLFLVLLPILIVFIYQVYQLVIVAKYENVEEDDDSEAKDDSVAKDEKDVETKEEVKITEREEKIYNLDASEEKNSDVELL